MQCLYCHRGDTQASRKTRSVRVKAEMAAALEAWKGPEGQACGGLGETMSGSGNTRCHSPSRVCPGPDRLSGQRKMRLREGTVATSEHLALCSAGGALGGLELSPGFQRVPLATALKTAEPALWRLLSGRGSSGILQFTSVTQSCPILCDTMDCSTPGLAVHHELPELTQTHVH